MKFKISYYINEKTDIEKTKERLNKINQQVKMIVSKHKDLDIVNEI